MCAGCRSRVYPRVCGGTIRGLVLMIYWLGLSPRVRGNRQGSAGRLRAMGSIPACAGEPASRRVRAQKDQVYPRVCGGTERFVSLATSLRGLSPRVRGNRTHFLLVALKIGSIPARAGEPRSSCPASYPPGVYPRACGGTLHRRFGSIQACGLSPRVRGNLQRPPFEGTKQPKSGLDPDRSGQ